MKGWLLLVSLFCGSSLFAQMQENLPGPSDPVSLDSVLNITVFVIVPLLMIVFLFFWIRRGRNQNESADEEESTTGSEKE